jgi:hypothetical protein
MDHRLTKESNFGIITLTAILMLMVTTAAMAQFSDSGQVNNEYERTDGTLAIWADDVVDYSRGYQDYAQTELGMASFGVTTDVLGDAGTAFSLGDGGSITLTFPTTITNGAGDDFVVFENGFVWEGVYMELGFVEVSSDGIIFSRLPALCRLATQPGPWTTSDPAQFYNLAGNFAGGTGFDLNDLILNNDTNVIAGLVNLDAITHVRVVDVVGDIAGSGATFDYLGRAVADPYPTPGESCGMDITGVAVISAGIVSVETSSWGHVKSLYR